MDFAIALNCGSEAKLWWKKLKVLNVCEDLSSQETEVESHTKESVLVAVYRLRGEWMRCSVVM